jgi:hypothetical protein
MTEIIFEKSRSINNDKFARMCEPALGEEFLWIGKPAKVGQRCEIRLSFSPNTGPTFCRLSGVVTHVGKLITEEIFDGVMSGQILRRNTCIPGVEPISRQNFDPIMAKKMLSGIIGKYGTVHGQRITVYAVLGPDFWAENGLPVKQDRVYSVVLKAEEHRICYWSVERVIDISDSFDPTKIPAVFCKWLKRNSWLLEESDTESSHGSWDD